MSVCNICYGISFDKFLKEINVSHKIFGNLEISKNIKLNTANGDHYLLSFKDNKRGLYEMEIQTKVSLENSNELINKNINLLKMSYLDKPSPYAGVVTTIEKCPAEFLPKLIKKNEGNISYEFYTAKAGARYQYGACNKENATYNFCSLFYYFKDKQLFAKVKYFNPIESKNCDEGVKNFFIGLNN
jgi:hypothetical protein